mgnify:FL=1
MLINELKIQWNKPNLNLQSLPAHWQQSSREAHGEDNLVQIELHSTSIWWCDSLAGSNRWKVNVERQRQHKCILDVRVKTSASAGNTPFIWWLCRLVNFQCSNTLPECKTGWCPSPKLSMRALYKLFVHLNNSAHGHGNICKKITLWSLLLGKESISFAIL